ncbi:MAG: carbohydrate kinase family protein [Nanoarchaeota archaeon]|nr:carbohydrate kinase family protein [Nanoarchaeota archaeon]
MGKIVCIGSLNVDIAFFVENFAGIDGEQIILNREVYSGGQAGNIAAGLGTLGKEAYFFGNIGEDDYTSLLLRDFEASNVNYSFAKRKQGANNYLCAIIDRQGRRQIYAYNDINFTEKDFPEKLYENTSFMIFASIIKEEAIEIYTQIAKKAKQGGTKIVLDPGNIFARLGIEKLRPLLEQCDYFLPSLTEVDLLVGGMNNIQFLREIVPTLVVKKGGEGAQLFSKEQEYSLPAKKVNAVDTTGAGDCFAAAFVACLDEGKSLQEALNFAVHAGTLSVIKKGARSMPSLREIEAFMR